MNNGKSIDDATSGYNPQDPYKNRDPRFYMTVLTNDAATEAILFKALFRVEKIVKMVHLTGILQRLVIT
jgi:hypothetical protein